MSLGGKGLRYGGVEVQLKTFLMLALDTRGWLHSPDTLLQVPTERKQECDIRCCGKDSKRFPLPTLEAQVFAHTAYRPVTNLAELFHLPYM
jgi:hypothetical protein